MSESKIQKEIRIACNTGSNRLFRNQSGIANINGRFVRFGIPECGGGSDLIGFKTITITQDQVGKKIAVFTAIECKSEKGKASEKQLNFINFIQSSGGIAGVARSAADALEIINKK